MNQQRYSFALQNLWPPGVYAPGCRRRCPHTAPCLAALPEPGLPLFLPEARPWLAGGSRRYRHTPGPSAASFGRERPAYTCASRPGRRGRATYPNRPWRRSAARYGDRGNPCAKFRQNSPRLSHTVGHSYWPDQSGSRPDRRRAERPHGRSQKHRFRQNSATDRERPAAIRSLIARTAETALRHTASHWLRNSSVINLLIH